MYSKLQAYSLLAK